MSEDLNVLTIKNFGNFFNSKIHMSKLSVGDENNLGFSFQSRETKLMETKLLPDFPDFQSPTNHLNNLISSPKSPIENRYMDRRASALITGHDLK